MVEHFPDATRKIDCITREAALDFHIPTYDLNISAQDERAIGDRFEEFLKSIPTADVRLVVTCGECKFWNRECISCEGFARCNTGESGVRYRKQSDFCSYGAYMVEDEGNCKND